MSEAILGGPALAMVVLYLATTNIIIAVFNLVPVFPLDGVGCCVPIVRRQGFWNQELLKLRESSAHLVGFIMRRVVCDASVALRASFV